jgi:hypothetical protein
MHAAAGSLPQIPAALHLGRRRRRLCRGSGDLLLLLLELGEEGLVLLV